MLVTELDFHNMTWGELRAFVALGQGIDDAAPVEMATSPYDSEPSGLRVDHGTKADAS